MKDSNGDQRRGKGKARDVDEDDAEDLPGAFQSFNVDDSDGDDDDGGQHTHRAGRSPTLHPPGHPPQSNGHQYRVRARGDCFVSRSWYEAGPATQGVPGAHVKAHRAGQFEPPPERQPFPEQPSGAYAHPSPPPTTPRSARSFGDHDGHRQQRSRTNEASEEQEKGKTPEKRRVDGSHDGDAPSSSSDEEDWYVVTRGYIPGVFPMSEAIEHTLGFAYGEYRYGGAYEDAWHLFRQAFCAGEVSALGDETPEERPQTVHDVRMGLRGFDFSRPPRSAPSPSFARSASSTPRTPQQLSTSSASSSASMPNRTQAATPSRPLPASSAPARPPWYLPPRPENRPYWVVTIGRRTGIFSSWAECQREVGRVSGAVHERYERWSPCMNGTNAGHGLTRHGATPTRRAW